MNLFQIIGSISIFVILLLLTQSIYYVFHIVLFMTIFEFFSYFSSLIRSFLLDSLIIPHRLLPTLENLQIIMFVFDFIVHVLGFDLFAIYFCFVWENSLSSFCTIIHCRTQAHCICCCCPSSYHHRVYSLGIMGSCWLFFRSLIRWMIICNHRNCIFYCSQYLQIYSFHHCSSQTHIYYYTDFYDRN